MVLVASKWVVREKIGEGSFGEVFAGEDTVTNHRVAIKREDARCNSPQLQHEYKLYKELGDCEGFPQCYYGGMEGSYNVMVMSCLGPSLKQLQQLSPAGTLPLRTIVYCIPQMIRRLKELHSRNIVFRDVKPGQFCVGHHDDDRTGRPTIFLVDLGLATHLADTSGKHNRSQKRENHRTPTGTARYASINVHKGKLNSRRDDIESLGYVVVELAKGRLPWSNMRAMSSHEGWRKTLAVKQDTLIFNLTEGLPEEFEELIVHARDLAFNDVPDYARLERMFLALGERMDQAASAGPLTPLEWEVPEQPGGW
ncbi:casein kinase I [Thoreauomyces humboldtii]|nr:casein kinase I [Thoreauomyces humboldtii]